MEHPLLSTYKKRLSEVLPLKSQRSWEVIKKELNLLLLPGSRNFEVKELLPEFINTVKQLKQKYRLKVTLLASPNVSNHLYAPYERYFNRVEKLTDALAFADICLAASGTVTLATALFEVPTIVSYRSSLFNEFIFYSFLSYRGPISLANIVHQTRVFPELLQDRANCYEMTDKIERWLTDREEYERIRGKLQLTRELLKGQLEDVGLYMAQIIKKAYEK